MQDFKDLKVWQKAHQLTLEVYRVTRRFPREELYGLTSQMRRAAVSVPANVAEGCCRSGDAEFARFAHITMASASELEYHLLLARDLQLMSTEENESCASSVSEVKRMLASLIRTLKARG